jgi:SAM-dependent methyltransferase
MTGLDHSRRDLRRKNGVAWSGRNGSSRQIEKPSMTDPIEINRRLWDERANIHARDTTGFYALDQVRSGEDEFHGIEAAELGDIAGKRVPHLQCHIGTDTLRLVRRGATVTGLDFSAEAIQAARRLADEAGLNADFVEGCVDDAPQLAPGPFDLVYITWGTICWLPDLKVWARVIATVLRPGGELYFADAHPGFQLMEERDGKLEPTYDFETPVDRPLASKSETTYTGDPTAMTHQSTREWIHPLSAIIEALIEAGLSIKMLHEHQILPWRGLPMMVPAPDGWFRLPDGHPRFPVSFSLRARKEH